MFSWSTGRYKARKSSFWETLCQSSCSRMLLLSSPHKCRVWRGSLSGALAILPLLCSHSSSQDPAIVLHRRAAFNRKLGQLVFPYSIHTSGNLPFGTLCQAWQLTCASCSSPSSQQRRKGSSLQHCLSPAPNASHTTQFIGRAAPRGGRKSRQTPWQIPTACKSGLHFSNTHMTPCKSLLAPQWSSAQPCLHKGWGLSQLPASGT